MNVSVVDSGLMESSSIMKMGSRVSPLFKRKSTPFSDSAGCVFSEGSIVGSRSDPRIIGIILFGCYRNTGQVDGGHYGFYICWNIRFARHDLLYWLREPSFDMYVLDNFYHLLDGKTYLNPEQLAAFKSAADYWVSEGTDLTDVP